MESKTFAELGLSSKVQAAIDAAGYKSPTPIQAAAIPIAVTGRDVLGIAQTGTGKTASFVLPMITRLETGRARARMPRSLILAPTRELAAQVAQSFEKYGVNNKLNLALLIGGVSMEDQVKRLDRGVDVLIATPGRLIDHFQRGRVMLMGVEILVIDEADRMLDMGFIPDIEKICKLLPPRRQTLFFSATMPPEITRLVSQFLTNPERVEVAPPATTAKTITQRFQYCEGGEDWVKREMLRDLIRETNVRNAIIFCNRKVDVAILHKSLTKHGFSAGALHGDLDQKSRMETLDKFRSGELKLLAASDVAARGLDIPDVSHVFNFDLPWQTDDYVHRIGRTGRAGKEGHSTSLVTFDELKSMKEIEKMLGEPAEWIGDAPSEEDFAEAGKKRRGRGGRNNAKRGRSGSGSGRSQSAEAGSQARSSDDKSRRSGSGSAKRAEVPVAASVEGEQPQLAAERSSDKPRRSRRRGGRGSGEARAASSASAPATEAAAAAPVARAASTSENAAPSRQPRNEDRAPRQSAPRNEQQPERAQQARAPRPQQEQRSDNRDRTPRDRDRQPEKRSLAFADNIPAFLRKPVRRPVKAASE